MNINEMNNKDNSYEQKKYDVVILATKKDLGLLKLTVPYVLTNLNPKKIYVVASEEIQNDVELIPGVVYYNESSVYQDLSYQRVENIIFRISGERKRAGWYLQQFIKLAWAYVTDDEEYVVIDSDTFPLNPINFYSKDGKYLFTEKVEFNKPYFDTITNLFGEKIKSFAGFSFVAEHMMFNKKYVLEMLGYIIENEALRGNNFFEKILYAVDPNEILHSGFSEFETYGNFMLTFHADEIRMRKLRTLREAVFVLGSTPSQMQLQWAAKDYDIISIELPNYKKTLLTRLTSSKLGTTIPLKVVANTRKKIRTIYRYILRKNNRVYD